MYMISHNPLSNASAAEDGRDRSLRHTGLGELLDALAAGILLTGGDGRVLYMNHAAACQVESGDALCVVNERLKPTDDSARASLMEAITKRQNDDTDSLCRLQSIALPGITTSGLVASVLPVNSTKNLALQSEVAAAVFLQAPFERTHLPSKAFARLYGLTGCELRTLISMSLSCNVEKAATNMGIKTSTAKTHLKHIYEKTGTAKLSELLLLFMHSVLRAELAKIDSDGAAVD